MHDAVFVQMQDAEACLGEQAPDGVFGDRLVNAMRSDIVVEVTTFAVLEDQRDSPALVICFRLDQFDQIWMLFDPVEVLHRLSFSLSACIHF